MLPTHHCLPDEATPHAVAGTWAQVECAGGSHTLAVWFGMYVLLLLSVPLFGGGVAVGRELGRSLFQTMP